MDPQAKISNLKAENKKLWQQNIELKDRIGKADHENTIQEMEEQINYIAKGIGNSANKPISLEDMRNEMKEEGQEFMEREERKNILAIYNIKESIVEDEEERRKDDHTECKSLSYNNLGLSKL